MKEKLEKLAARWPKDSEWKLVYSGHDEFWFMKPNASRLMTANGSDLSNSDARTIIEDELIRLGFPYISWSHSAKGIQLLISGPTLSFKWIGLTRTQSLVRVAIEVLNATQPTPERHISKGAPAESQLQDDKQGARQGLDGPSLGGIEE